MKYFVSKLNFRRSFRFCEVIIIYNARLNILLGFLCWCSLAFFWLGPEATITSSSFFIKMSKKKLDTFLRSPPTEVLKVITLNFLNCTLAGSGASKARAQWGILREKPWKKVAPNAAIKRLATCVCFQFGLLRAIDIILRKYQYISTLFWV